MSCIIELERDGVISFGPSSVGGSVLSTWGVSAVVCSVTDDMWPSSEETLLPDLAGEVGTGFLLVEM